MSTPENTSKNRELLERTGFRLSPVCVATATSRPERREKRHSRAFYEAIILKGLIFFVIYGPSTILISSSVNSYNS